MSRYALFTTTALVIGVGLFLWRTSNRPVIPEADATEAKQSLAVIPFANMSPETADSGYTSGITRDLIDAFSESADLHVVPWDSVAPIGQHAVGGIADVRRLGATIMLEGSVRHSVERIRITAQLIDTRTGAHWWSESFDRELTELPQVRNDIVQAVRQVLRPNATPAELR
jgi:TolB-like protein